MASVAAQADLPLAHRRKGFIMKAKFRTLPSDDPIYSEGVSVFTPLQPRQPVAADASPHSSRPDGNEGPSDRPACLTGRAKSRPRKVSVR